MYIANQPQNKKSQKDEMYIEKRPHNRNKSLRGDTKKEQARKQKVKIKNPNLTTYEPLQSLT